MSSCPHVPASAAPHPLLPAIPHSLRPLSSPRPGSRSRYRPSPRTSPRPGPRTPLRPASSPRPGRSRSSPAADPGRPVPSALVGAAAATGAGGRARDDGRRPGGVGLPRSPSPVEAPAAVPRPVAARPLVSAPVRIADPEAVRLLKAGDRVDVIAAPLPAGAPAGGGPAARVVASAARVVRCRARKRPPNRAPATARAVRWWCCPCRGRRPRNSRRRERRPAWRWPCADSYARAVASPVRVYRLDGCPRDACLMAAPTAPASTKGTSVSQENRTSLLEGFKAFLMRGNVIDLAVAVVIGAAFTNIVNSIVKGVISPSWAPSARRTWTATSSA